MLTDHWGILLNADSSSVDPGGCLVVSINETLSGGAECFWPRDHSEYTDVDGQLASLLGPGRPSPASLFLRSAELIMLFLLSD